MFLIANNLTNNSFRKKKLCIYDCKKTPGLSCPAAGGEGVTEGTGMNVKLVRLLDEIQKTEEKIAAWQEHLKELNMRRKQMEDAEIIKGIRSMKLGSREMLALLDGIQDGTVSIRGMGSGSEADAVEKTGIDEEKGEQNGEKEI